MTLPLPEEEAVPQQRCAPLSWVCRAIPDGTGQAVGKGPGMGMAGKGYEVFSSQAVFQVRMCATACLAACAATHNSNILLIQTYIHFTPVSEQQVLPEEVGSTAVWHTPGSVDGLPSCHVAALVSVVMLCAACAHEHMAYQCIWQTDLSQPSPAGADGIPATYICVVLSACNQRSALKQLPQRGFGWLLPCEGCYSHSCSAIVLGDA